MSNLESMNYIHTLFVCEFQTTHNIASCLREFLIRGKELKELWFDYISIRCNATTLSTHYDDNIYWLFNTDEEKETWIRTIEDITTLSKILIIEPQFNILNVQIMGHKSTYLLHMRLEQEKYIFQEMKYSYDGTHDVTQENLTEEQFGSKVEALLNILTSTNQIPFEQYGVE